MSSRPIEQAGRDTRVLVTVQQALLSLLLLMLFAGLTSLGALVRIPLPFTPVPVTLQTLMVLLAGAMLGGARGSLSQVLYVAWGASGLPLFAGAAAGFAVLAGPTGGYLIGFVGAAWLVGRLIRGADTVAKQAGVFAAGALLILAFGWLHMLAFYTGGDAARALTLAVLPFLPGAALKVIAATSIWRAWTALRAADQR
ncbi:MAG: Biotin transporter BioY [Calditrichaeota bacterium]|nr:Biotin transporter BioY [Calditrichota bacterium]